jgi:hypothetical protein
VYYIAGREAHKNLLVLGILKLLNFLNHIWLALMVLLNALVLLKLVSLSQGLLSHRNDFFSDYSFTYGYPSGYGSTVFVGGNKTPFVAVGGNIKAKFLHSSRWNLL